MAETQIEGIDREEAVALFGSRDENLRLFRDLLGLKVVARGDRVSLQGPTDQVDLGVRVLAQMRAAYQKSRALAPDDVKVLIDRLQPSVETPIGGGPAGPTTEITGPVRRLFTKTQGQRDYIQAMRSHDLVLCVGPAGTGKTFLAVAQALEDLHQRRIKRIILVRPAVEAGEKLGFLPGDMQAKVNPYLRPLLDALRDMLDFQQVRAYLENDVVELAPLAYMRGRTLSDAFIILDEGQNTTIPQMQMFLTRMGMGSKIVVTGDVTQIDLPPGTRSGLKDAIARLGRLPGVATVRMGRGDIVRHALVQAIVDAYEKSPRTIDEDRRLEEDLSGSVRTGESERVSESKKQSAELSEPSATGEESSADG